MRETGDAGPQLYAEVAGAIPSSLAISREGFWESSDWRTGDRAFDRCVKIAAAPHVLSFALGKAQRDLLFDLHMTGVRYEVAAGSFSVWRKDCDVYQLGSDLRTILRLMKVWVVAAPERAPVYLEHAKADPQPEMRAAAIGALALLFPRTLNLNLPALRRDKTPLVRLAVAIATRDPSDVRVVPIAELDASERRRLWDHASATLPKDERDLLVRKLLRETKAESDAQVYAAAFVADAPVTELPLYLDHKVATVRLLAIRALGQRGDSSHVPALRELERSALFNRMQVKACREAIVRIQHAITGDRGAVTLGSDDRGALSKDR